MEKIGGSQINIPIRMLQGLWFHRLQQGGGFLPPHRHFAVRSLFNLSSSHVADSSIRLPSEPEHQNAFKDLMAASWDELPNALISDVEAVLSKNTGDEAGNEIVTNVYRAAEAVEEFSGILVTLKMEIVDSIGLSSKNVKPIPDYVNNALCIVFDRYTTYLNSFGPEETYLRKKVETELGSKMIYLKMRCSGLDSEWGTVMVLGTSGLSGSYVEQRAQ